MTAKRKPAKKAAAKKPGVGVAGYQRDVTIALGYALALEKKHPEDHDARSLVEVLTIIDARTGRRDPTIRAQMMNDDWKEPT